jgi:ribosome-associated toxin RatA of RatAB toxin-antitoxin module
VVPFSPSEVWRVLTDLAAFPGWWPRRLQLRVLHREPGLVGSEVEMRPFGGRPFLCRVESVEEPCSIRTQYHGGFITGRGEWRLEPSGSGTRVRYELDVQAEGRVVAWLDRVLPLGRIHSSQMHGVFRQLERALGSRMESARPGREKA